MSVLLLAALLYFVDIAHCLCQIDDTAMNNVLDSLKNDGYVIEKGYLEWKFNRSSYGANPSFVYGIYNFERIEFENITHPSSPSSPSSSNNNIYTAPNTNDIKSDINITIRTHQSINNFWFMYGSTALLFYGCLPPSSHYFSYRSYVNRRYNPANTTNFTTKYIPEENPYGSLGDMLNHRIINHTLNKKINRNVSIIISTGDTVSYKDISNKFIQQNLSNIINLDSIPQEWIKYKEKDWMSQLLNGGTVDSTGIMLRSYNQPTVNVSYKEFVQYFMGQNQTVYKIYHKDHETSKPRQPYNTSSAVRYNDTKDTEIIVDEHTYNNSALLEGYNKYLQLLVEFMTNDVNNYQYKSTIVGVPFYKGRIGYGYECIEWGTRCLADNRDCQYFMTWPQVSYLPRDNKTIQFIVGVIHPDMNICEWGSIVPYFPQDGIAEFITNENYRAEQMVLMDFEYRYSALKFPFGVGDDIPYNILNKFFIISVMRPGSVDEYKYFNMTPSFVIDTDKMKYKDGYNPLHRCYINKKTNTRPPPQNMIPMTVVEFIKYY